MKKCVLIALLLLTSCDNTNNTECGILKSTCAVKYYPINGDGIKETNECVNLYKNLNCDIKKLHKAIDMQREYLLTNNKN